MRNSLGPRFDGPCIFHGIYVGVEHQFSTFVQEAHANSRETEHSMACSNVHASRMPLARPRARGKQVALLDMECLAGSLQHDGGAVVVPA